MRIRRPRRKTGTTKTGHHILLFGLLAQSEPLLAAQVPQAQALPALDLKVMTFNLQSGGGGGGARGRAGGAPEQSVAQGAAMANLNQRTLALVTAATEARTRTRHDWTAERTGNKIDYVFAPPNAEVVDAAILYDNNNGRYPSDHYPVFARIKIPPGAQMNNPPPARWRTFKK